MPLEKRFRGRRIRKTKRRSGRVLVCLESRVPGQPDEWVAASTAEYPRQRRHCFVPRRKA